MATVEHCLYCFETLAAELEDRKPLTLDQVKKSWAEYVSSTATSESSDAIKQSPALRRLAASSSSSTSSSSSSLSLSSSTPATSISSSPAPPEEEPTSTPLFITWNTNHPRHGYILRGCIGTFEAQPLTTGLSSYALISALQDSRFHPISLGELPKLQVAVTLLTDFEDAADKMDWELGKHGIRISFYERGRRYGATYLPDVATEQEWTKEETLISLMRKAGWSGKGDDWEKVDLKVVRYQGRKEKLEYAAFKEWRDWVEKNQN
ncbi:AMMECR1 domain-containing protein [Triangularia verruculosa]|uniref:AMMECR1 domain-containing protein n=1 Tax=Triangularia verruculosa TaxID=2587418 RepID=A0AAN6XNH0_9PEZI|nr:AMMECR1 domain-containing protein [Triangularia verruculosa]